MASRTEITCQECETAFLYTDAERAFRESRGLERPLLCPECRARERSRRNDDLISLYNKTESFEPFLWGKETQNGGGGNSGRAREGQTLHRATCAQCGADTKVPFIPRGDRPVYCRACYNARRGR
jgi:CxxC-x17-CxxC domain-containing protein